MDYVVTRYSHLLDMDEGICGVFGGGCDVDTIFPKIYNHNVNKFRIIYNTPKCLHCFTDDLFAMIKKEADSVMSGKLSTKLSIYSCHDTSVMRTKTIFSEPQPC